MKSEYLFTLGMLFGFCALGYFKAIGYQPHLLDFDLHWSVYLICGLVFLIGAWALGEGGGDDYGEL